MKIRLDKELLFRGLVSSRSQAENYIKLGFVVVDKKVVKKPGYGVSTEDKIKIIGDKYVSRAALKLSSIAEAFKLDFRGKLVLDVGSSTGGFTDFALQHGAEKVVAVDVGTEQLHHSLRVNPKVELHEKTDIRDFEYDAQFDVIVADVSFISLTKIMPSLIRHCNQNTELVMMCKPQFEAQPDQVNKGVIKNSSMRRQILKDFESWLIKNGFVIRAKADSQVAGTKGNVERFYKLKCKL